MNKRVRNGLCFTQFKNSYGHFRAELGFFQASCFFVLRLRDNRVFLSNFNRPIKLALRLRAPTQA